MDIKNTNLYNELVKRKSGYIDNINKVYARAEEILPKINRVFANYTGHGIEHSLNVIQYMFDLINDINMLSDLEITCLIYSALLHDVGMVVSEKEIKEIKEDILLCNGRKYSAIHEKNQDELECIQECVRPIQRYKGRKQTECRIETVGFEVSDLKLNVDYSAIVNSLMGENVYGNKKYGLRELIQNSLDACKVM